MNIPEEAIELRDKLISITQTNNNVKVAKALENLNICIDIIKTINPKRYRETLLPKAIREAKYCLEKLV